MNRSLEAQGLNDAYRAVIALLFQNLISAGGDDEAMKRFTKGVVQARAAYEAAQAAMGGP